MDASSSSCTVLVAHLVTFLHGCLIPRIRRSTWRHYGKVSRNSSPHEESMVSLPLQFRWYSSIYFRWYSKIWALIANKVLELDVSIADPPLTSSPEEDQLLPSDCKLLDFLTSAFAITYMDKATTNLFSYVRNYMWISYVTNSLPSLALTLA